MKEPEYLTRMREEHDQLSEKIVKLKVFLNKPDTGIGINREALLRLQLSYMIKYQNTLQTRIDLETEILTNSQQKS